MFVGLYQEATTLNWRMGKASFIFDYIEPELRLFIMGKVHPNEAEDVLQETFKAILTGLDSFRGKKSREFWKWCYQIARNKIADHYRTNSRVMLFQKEEVASLLRLSSRTETFTAEDRADVKHAMDVLEKSKPGCQEILWKRYVIGFTYDEIAEELGLKSDLIRMRVNRCLSAARKLLGV